MSAFVNSCRLLILLVPGLLAASAEAQSFVVERLEVPAAPGSRSPNLAAGNGQLVVSWIEPDDAGHRLRFSVLDDQRWTRSRTVASGNDWFVNWADFPAVVPIHDSLWAAHWLVRQPAGGYAYDISLAFSGDDGATWSEPRRPHDDNTPTEHGFVTLYPHADGAGLIWLDGRNTAGGTHDGSDHGSGGMTLRAAVYGDGFRQLHSAEIDALICDCCQTDVAITDEGPIAAYRDRSKAEVRDIYTMRQVGGEWQAEQPVADDGWVIEGCPVNGPAIVAEGSRVAVAWFTGANDEPRIRLARSADSGASFAPPVDVFSGEMLGRAGLAFLPDGAVAVSWLCKSASTSSVCMRTVTNEGELGPVQRISGGDSVPALSVPQLAGTDHGLVAVWSAEVDGKPAIHAATIRPRARSL